MSEQREMLSDAVTRLFRDAGEVATQAEQQGWQQGLWDQVEALGLPLVLISEVQGGVGGDWEDAHAVLHAAGAFAIPLPIGEAMLASRLAANAGLELPKGAASIAVQIEGKLSAAPGGQRFSGRVSNVPWGRHVKTIAAVLTADGSAQLILLARSDATSIVEAVNTAGEPRDNLQFDDALVSTGRDASPEATSLSDYAALLRTAQIVGALEAALHRSIDYAKERKQFGRAIGQFQAVQQQLALFGADTAAVSCAARAASRAATMLGSNASFAIGCAKLRANQAIGPATATAHQVHAAIGFTQEYALHHYTRRLWAWRSEFGNDRYWGERIGARVAARGAEHFWADLTGRDDKTSAEAAR